MAGRNAKPVLLHLAGGNKSHLTKAEIEHRQATEIKIGDSRLVCPSYVRANAEAYKKWREVMKLYAGIPLVSSGDVGLLARYCMAFSEYINLIQHREKINACKFSAEEIQEAQDELREEMSNKAVNETLKKIEYILSVGGVLSLDKAINAKMDALVKMEDRLFLNPLAKIKNIPKEPEKEKEDPLTASGFGGI